MYIATVTWSPEFDAEHIVTVEADHSVKSCAKKNPELDVSFDCDVRLPETISHMVVGPTEEGVMRAARTWAFAEMPFGAEYLISYVGRLAG